MRELEIKFPILGNDNLKKLNTAHEERGIKYYVATIRASALCKQGKDLKNWSELNPRDPNRSSYVWKEMMETLDYYPEKFIYRNKGVLIMVDSLIYDNKNKSINIKLTNKSCHGVADGGHTLEVLKEYIKNNKDDNDVFVKVEFLVGFEDKEEVVDVVTARNTAKQVQDESIMDAKGEFDEIKRRLKDEIYENRISYSEYQINKRGDKKDISIKEIIGMLIAFDNDSFDDENPPIIAYSGKKTALKHYHKKRDLIDKKYTPLLPKILKLWDTIYEEFPSIYKGNILKAKKSNSDKSLVKDLSKKNKRFELRFISNESDYKIPPAWIFPLFSAFKNLIEERNGIAMFPKDKDPVKFFLKNKQAFTKALMNALEDSNNDPQTFAKSKTCWTVFSNKVRRLMEE